MDGDKKCKWKKIEKVYIATKQKDRTKENTASKEGELNRKHIKLYCNTIPIQNKYKT